MDVEVPLTSDQDTSSTQRCMAAAGAVSAGTTAEAGAADGKAAKMAKPRCSHDHDHQQHIAPAKTAGGQAGEGDCLVYVSCILE